MNKLLGILVLFAVMASSVLATDLTLNPDLTTMAPTDVKVVDACIVKSSGGPYVGVALAVTTYCQDLNNNEVCDGADVMFPGTFSAVVTSTPTDVTGCGKVTLTTTGASGQYVYRVNGQDAGVEVAAESGLVLVPEFTTVGAGLALAGAGLYMNRKRRK